MTETILNLDDLSIPFANRGTATVIDGSILLPDDFREAYGSSPSLAGQTLTITGLQAGDTIDVTDGLSISNGLLLFAESIRLASVTRTENSISFTILSNVNFNAGTLDYLIESLTFQTTDSRSFSTRDLTFSVNTPTFPQTGTVQITIGTPPPVIGGMDDLTIPFETRFVRNLIDGDVTLPDSFATAYDGTNGTLNGRTLSITGLQFGDAIRFTPESGFVAGFPNTTLNGNPVASTAGNAISFALTFTTDFTAAQLEQLLQSMTFQAGATNPAAASRTLTYSLNTPTALTGTVDITMSAPEARNQIEDLDNQNVVGTGNLVTLDSAITLSDEFHAAYAAAGSLNNLTMAVTGWTGQQIPVATVSGSGVSIVSANEFSSNVLVGDTQIGTLNVASGTIFFNANARAALVETLIESLTINPQLGNQNSRTITVTIMTPTAPQFGTVTFTSVPFALNDLRDSLDVSLNTVSTYGVKLDDDVSISGNGSWAGALVEVTGLQDGDKIIVDTEPSVNTGLWISEDGTQIWGERRYPFTGLIFVPIATFGTQDGVFTIILRDGVTVAEIDTMIQSLRFVTESSGSRTLTVSLTDATNFSSSHTVTVNVAAPPTLTDMVETLDLTMAQAAGGQSLDADVSFRGDASFDGGSLVVSGVGPGEAVTLREGGGSPFVNLFGTVLYFPEDGGTSWHVGTLSNTQDGLRLDFSNRTTAADIEAMLEHLVFRTTAPSPAASRVITITITDANGDAATQVITVNTLPAGARQMAYEILQNEDGVLVPFAHPSVSSAGITSDLNPASLFSRMTAPDSFVMRYTGLLSVDSTFGGGEQSIFTFAGFPVGSLLEVNGSSFRLGSDGRIALDLAPGGLHMISLLVPYETVGGNVGPTPTLTYGEAVPPMQGSLWPVYTQTNLFQNVRLVPEMLHRIEVTTTISEPGLEPYDRVDIVYLTSLSDIQTQLNTMAQALFLPPNSSVSQSYTTVTEITGGTGADTLAGLAGRDVLNGGAGDDLLMGSLGADTIDGGTGVNTLSYQGSTGGVTVSLTSGVGLGGNAAGDIIRNVQNVIGTQHADRITGSSENNRLSGAGGRDTLFGEGGNDVLDGGTNNDVLFGGAGNDTLTGGSGQDTLDGGAGNDVFYVDHADDVVLAAAGEGTADRVLASVSYTLGAGAAVEHLSTVSTSGLGPINLTGNALEQTITGNEGENILRGMGGNDTLYGRGGDDYIDGGTGADRMIGGAGNDTYVVDSLTDAVIETVGQGTADRVLVATLTSFELSASQHIEVLSALDAAGTAAMALTGNSLAQSITGNAGVNVLRGLDGDDSLFGLDGNDSLFGGNGADSLDGGAGSDRLLGGTGNDTLTGQDGDDVLLGEAGADAIYGGAGNDVLRGGAGADTLDGGAGFNTLSYEGASSGVGVNLRSRSGFEGDALGDVIINIQRVIGSSHDDQLYGNRLSDVLVGGAGNDTIAGNAGDDRLAGGSGADTFIFTEGFGSDQITDFSQGDRIALELDVWGGASLGDALQWIELYGHQVGSFVEFRFSETDILRIDNMTLEGMYNSIIYWG